MSEVHPVGILGAGSFGTALARVLAAAGRPVLLCSQTPSVVESINRDHRNEDRLPGVELPASLRATGDLAELADHSSLLVLALGPDDVRARARELGDVLDGSHRVVHAIGALATEGDAPVSEVLAEELPTLRIGALAGPATSADLAAGRVASMVCASRFDDVSRLARAALSAPPGLRLYCSQDLVGVELAAALSGVYTIALGLADGMAVGPGTRAVLITRIIAEASRLGAASHADPWTFAGLAGLGNLLVRGCGPESTAPEYQMGLGLAQGQALPERAPVGVRAAAALSRLAERRRQRMPVLGALAAVLEGRLSPKSAAQAIADHVALEE